MSNKVVSFAQKKKEMEEKKDVEEKKEEVQQTETSFEDIIKKNQENQERVKKERAKANKKVTRDYRLK